MSGESAFIPARAQQMYLNGFKPYHSSLQPPTLELEWALEQTLAFVLREAVTNAVRHAQAKHLWVSLERAGRGVRLSIWDDGTGQILEGNGVRGMRERVQALGGVLELDAKGKGVTVRV